MFSKLNFNREILINLRKTDYQATYEMALPSYLHSNPFVRWIVAWRMKTAIRLLEIGTDRKILDYGCGLGILFLQLPEGKNEYFGTDLDIRSADEVLSAHGRDDVNLFLVKDIEKNIKDEALDNIITIEVLEHIEDISDTLRLFKRKLKPGGNLIISGPTENMIYALLRKIANFSGEYHIRNIYDITDIIKDEGFVKVEKVTIPFCKPFDVFVIYKFIYPGQLPIVDENDFNNQVDDVEGK